MPIDVEEMESADGNEVGYQKRQEKVAGFLKENKDSAWTNKEIAYALMMPVTTVANCLYALEKKSVVVRKRLEMEGGRALIHWCWKEDKENDI